MAMAMKNNTTSAANVSIKIILELTDNDQVGNYQSGSVDSVGLGRLIINFE